MMGYELASGPTVSRTDGSHTLSFSLLSLSLLCFFHSLSLSFSLHSLALSPSLFLSSLSLSLSLSLSFFLLIPLSNLLLVTSNSGGGHRALTCHSLSPPLPPYAV